MRSKWEADNPTMWKVRRKNWMKELKKCWKLMKKQNKRKEIWPKLKINLRPSFTKLKTSWKIRNLLSTPGKVKEKISLNWPKKNKPGMTNLKAKIHKITRESTISSQSLSKELRRESLNIMREITSRIEHYPFWKSIWTWPIRSERVRNGLPRKKWKN